MFIALSTQWRVGYSGATGLDYAVLPGVMSLCGVPADRQSEVFEGIREMEGAALTTMRKANK